MKRRLTAAFLTACAVSGILAHGRTSSAYLILAPAAACAANTANGSLPAHKNTGIESTSTVGAAIVCPYVEHSDNLKSSVSIIYVDVFDGDSRTSVPQGIVSAQACSSPFGGGSVHCGGMPNTGASFTGNTTITLSGTDVTNAWNASFDNDYGTVFVSLPRSSRLIGYATE